MAEHHEAELVGRVHGVVVWACRLEVVSEGGGRCGIEAPDLIVVDRLELVVVFPGDAGGDVLVGESEDREPEEVAVDALEDGCEDVDGARRALAMPSPGAIVLDETVFMLGTLFS